MSRRPRRAPTSFPALIPPFPLFPRPRFAVRPLALAARLSVAACVAAASGAAAPAFAQAVGVSKAVEGAARRYDIPAGSLSAALTRFASESGIYLAGNTDLAKDARSPGLKGDYTVQAGLAALLGGSGLEAVPNASGQYVLRAAPAMPAEGAQSTLPAVKVIGERDGEAARRLNPPTTVGSKTPLTQREIAQTVQVVTAQQIEQQQLVDLNDAVKQVPGMTAAPYTSSQVDFYSRGFPVDIIQLDGIPFNVNTSANGLTNLNLAMYDHIEVLDGPAGLLSGFGGAGGAINLVRKKPQRDFALNADVSGGSDSNRMETVDVTGPLNQAGTLRGRFVETYQDTNEPQDGTFRKQGLVYGVLEADVTPDTLVSVGASYQRIVAKMLEQGYPLYSNFQPFYGPSTFIGSPDNRDIFTTTTAFGSIEQRLPHGWKAKFTVQAFDTSSSVRSAYPYGNGIDVNTGNTKITSFANHESNVQRTFDLFASGPFTLFGKTHQLTVGMDYQTYHYSLHDDYTFNSSQTWNLYDPVLPSIGAPDTFQTSFVETSQFNLYSNARFRILDPLTFVVGGSVSWWSVRNTYDANANDFGLAPSAYHLSAKVTPFFGLIYDIDDHLSAYASYTSVYEPQSAIDSSGNLIAPLKGNQVELGVKGEYLDGKLNTSASIFEVTQENRAVADPEDPTSGFDVATGRARSRGFQLSASGELLPGWTLFGGYTYTDVYSLDSSQSATGTSGQSFTSIAPKHLLRLWTHYRFHGNWDRLNVGGGINVSSRYYVKDTDYTLTQGGYATVDLQAGYQVSKNVRAQVVLHNLFDRRYYQSLGGVGNGNFIGDPRSVLFTLHFQM